VQPVPSEKWGRGVLLSVLRSKLPSPIFHWATEGRKRRTGDAEGKGLKHRKKSREKNEKEPADKKG